MGFTIKPAVVKERRIRTKQGKWRRSLFQPPAFIVEFHTGPTTAEDFARLFGGGPLERLSIIVEQSKTVLRDAGLPDREMVMTTGDTYRRLTAKEKKSTKPLPNAESTFSLCGGDYSPTIHKESKQVAKRRIEVARKAVAEYGEFMIRVSGPEFREVREEDREDPETAVLIVPPGFGAKPLTAAWFAARAIELATVTQRFIEDGNYEAALTGAMDAVDMYWKSIRAEDELALLAGRDVLQGAEPTFDRKKAQQKIDLIRRKHPAWGATAVRKQASEELTKEEGRGYSLSNLRSVPVPEKRRK